MKAIAAKPAANNDQVAGSGTEGAMDGRRVRVEQRSIAFVHTEAARCLGLKPEEISPPNQIYARFEAKLKGRSATDPRCPEDRRKMC
jgi:hypothetical protein